MIKVLPSSNPCPEDKLLEYVKELEKLDVEYLHCDVMDGKFVESKCLSFELLETIRNNTNILLDVHLMVEDSLDSVKKFAKLYPNIITIHYESPKNLREINKIIRYLKSKDIMVGMSIKPSTPVSMLDPFIDDLDLILIMSVEPGKSGQVFINSSIEKIKEAKNLIADRNIILEVDGGINLDNYQAVVKAGADFLVMGNAFFKSTDKKQLLVSVDKHYKTNNK